MPPIPVSFPLATKNCLLNEESPHFSYDETIFNYAIYNGNPSSTMVFTAPHHIR